MTTTTVEMTHDGQLHSYTYETNNPTDLILMLARDVNRGILDPIACAVLAYEAGVTATLQRTIGKPLHATRELTNP